MVTIGRNILVTVLAFFPLLGIAEGKDSLFVEVTADEESRLTKKGHRYFEQIRYISKRYRIVKINPEALLGGASSITISPFGDVPVSLNLSSLTVKPNDLGFIWQGHYAGAPESRSTSISRLTEQGVDAHSANLIYDSVFSIKIYGSKYVYDDSDGRSISMSGIAPDSSGVLAPAAAETIHKSSQNVQEFYEILVDITPPPTNSSQHGSGQAGPLDSYQVRSVPFDRRYHVVFEVKRENIPPAGKFNTSQYPEAAEKLRQFREFRQSLDKSPTPPSQENPR